jgi:mRNA interferase HigB
MMVISRKQLREFWERHPDSKDTLESWYADIKQANWKNPSDIKTIYRNASFIADNRVIFNVKGNKYHLIVKVQYKFQIVYIRFVGTHEDYDGIDARTI